jgi:hypothetical protein
VVPGIPVRWAAFRISLDRVTNVRYKEGIAARRRTEEP